MAPPAGDFDAGGAINWRLSGRLALSDGRDGGSGQFEWEQRGERAEMRFHAAFGRRSWRLHASPGEAILELSTGERFVASRVEALVREHVGWEVPVAALRYWVRGITAPGARAQTQRDGNERLALIRQLGWVVRYDGFLQVDGMILPRRITATRDRNRVRLVVREWDVDSPGRADKMAPVASPGSGSPGGLGAANPESAPGRKGLGQRQRV